MIATGSTSRAWSCQSNRHLGWGHLNRAFDQRRSGPFDGDFREPALSRPHASA